MKRTTLALAMLGASAAPVWSQPATADRIAQIDLSGDGAITRAKARTVRERMFDRLDANRDGDLSGAEFERAQGRAARSLRNADEDRDGRVSRAEALALPHRAFYRLDGDNDGVLSAAELQVVRARANGG